MTRTNGVQHSGGHARWAALSHTIGAEEKVSGMSEHAKYVRELPVSGTGARRRGPQISADPVHVREKTSASMNGSVMRQGKTLLGWY